MIQHVVEGTAEFEVLRFRDPELLSGSEIHVPVPRASQRSYAGIAECAGRVLRESRSVEPGVDLVLFAPVTGKTPNVVSRPAPRSALS